MIRSQLVETLHQMADEMGLPDYTWDSLLAQKTSDLQDIHMYLSEWYAYWAVEQEANAVDDTYAEEDSLVGHLVKGDLGRPLTDFVGIVTSEYRVTEGPFTGMSMVKVDTTDGRTVSAIKGLLRVIPDDQPVPAAGYVQPKARFQVTSTYDPVARTEWYGVRDTLTGEVMARDIWPYDTAVQLAVIRNTYA